MSNKTLSVDILLHAVMEQKGIDVRTVISEINWWRNQGIYLFSSGRRLGVFPTRHHPIYSLPHDFPPIMLTAGKRSNAFLTIDRFYLSNSTAVNYISNSSSASYILPSMEMPSSLKNGLEGMPVRSAIQGSPDERPIIKVYASKRETEITVNPTYITFDDHSESFDPDYEIISGDVEFSEGKILGLEQIFSVTPDAKGERIFKRKKIEYCAFRVNTAKGCQVYIAALPFDKSRDPYFKAKGFYRHNHLKCFVANAQDVDPAQLSATMHHAEKIEINAGKIRTLLASKLILDQHEKSGK